MSLFDIIRYPIPHPDIDNINDITTDDITNLHALPQEIFDEWVSQCIAQSTENSWHYCQLRHSISYTTPERDKYFFVYYAIRYDIKKNLNILRNVIQSHET